MWWPRLDEDHVASKNTSGIGSAWRSVSRAHRSVECRAAYFSSPRDSKTLLDGLRYLAARELHGDGPRICRGDQCVEGQSRRGMRCKGGICQSRSRQGIVMVRLFVGLLLLLCCVCQGRRLWKDMGREYAHSVGGCMRQDTVGLLMFSIFVRAMAIFRN
jgi:hypothetical protein